MCLCASEAAGCGTMANAEDLLSNPEKFFRDTCADVVGNKRGHYFREEEARRHMQPSDTLYELRARRLA